MELITILSQRLDLFLIILARISGLFFMAPIFSSRNIPGMVKIGLSGLVAFLILGVYPYPFESPSNLWSFSFMMLTEVLIGLVIGFTAQMVFVAIQMAGQVIDMQMGFAIVNVVDPIYGNQIPLMGNFKYMLALLLFLIVNGHHFLFTALLKSFELVPLYSLTYRPELTGFLVSLFGGMLVTAVKISLPVSGVLFVTDVCMGILARTVPQMNIFIVGLPLKIFLGLGLIMLVLPLYIFILNIIFNKSFADTLQILRLLS